MDKYKVLWQNRKKLIINFFVTAFITAGISLTLPKTYRATAVVIPPKQQGGYGAMSMLADLPFDLIGQTSEQIEFLRAILESRTLFTNIAERFNLQERYGTKDIEGTLKTLRGRVVIEITEEGTIKISAKAKTPFLPDSPEELDARKFSATLTNEFVNQLDEMNRRLASQQSRSNREFIEKRYNGLKENMAETEERFAEFQVKYGTIALPEQLSASIELAATYEAEIGMTEVRLGVTKASLGANHPEVLRTENELEQLKKKMKSVLGNSEQNLLDSTLANRLFPAFSDVPELGKQFYRLEREIEIQGLMYAFLSQEYERAKIEEARDTPTIQVIDYAVPPIKKDRPRRSSLVIFATFLSTLIYVGILVGREPLSGFINRLNE